MAAHFNRWSDTTLQAKLALVGVVAVLVVWHLRRPAMHVLEAAFFVLSLAIVWLGLSLSQGSPVVVTRKTQHVTVLATRPIATALSRCAPSRGRAPAASRKLPPHAQARREMHACTHGSRTRARPTSGDALTADTALRSDGLSLHPTSSTSLRRGARQLCR
jgi:hypothetical protein